jgi:hypothetical protein
MSYIKISGLLSCDTVSLGEFPKFGGIVVPSLSGSSCNASTLINYFYVCLL